MVDLVGMHSFRNIQGEIHQQGVDHAKIEDLENYSLAFQSTKLKHYHYRASNLQSSGGQNKELSVADKNTRYFRNGTGRVLGVLVVEEYLVNSFVWVAQFVEAVEEEIQAYQ